jgi:hypothetical protein
LLKSRIPTRSTKDMSQKAETLSSDERLRRIAMEQSRDADSIREVFECVDWNLELVCYFLTCTVEEEGQGACSKESPREHKINLALINSKPMRGGDHLRPHGNPNAMHSRVPYCRQSLLTLTNAPGPPSELSRSTRTSAWATTFSRAAEDGLPSDTVID